MGVYEKDRKDYLKKSKPKKTMAKKYVVIKGKAYELGGTTSSMKSKAKLRKVVKKAPVQSTGETITKGIVGFFQNAGETSLTDDKPRKKEKGRTFLGL